MANSDKVFVREDIDSATHFRKGLRFFHGSHLRQLAQYTPDGSVTAIAFGQLGKNSAVVAVARDYLLIVTRLGLLSYDVVELWLPKITALDWTDGPVTSSVHVVGSGADLFVEKIDQAHKIRTAVKSANTPTEA